MGISLGDRVTSIPRPCASTDCAGPFRPQPVLQFCHRESPHGKPLPQCILWHPFCEPTTLARLNLPSRSAAESPRRPPKQLGRCGRYPPGEPRSGASSPDVRLCRGAYCGPPYAVVAALTRPRQCGLEGTPDPTATAAWTFVIALPASLTAPPLLREVGTAFPAT